MIQPAWWRYTLATAILALGVALVVLEIYWLFIR